MSWHRRLLNLGRTRRLNREIRRELDFHMAERTEELRAQGMSAQAAAREAQRRLGNAELQRERTRDADVVVWLDSLLRDVRHAARGLVRAPLFACVAVASLALGIGANTAIFTLIDAVVLRPLPVSSPSELVVLGIGGEEAGFFTNPLWEAIDERQSGFSALAAFGETRLNLAQGGEPRWLNGVWVSGDYFRLFGVGAAAGRVLQPADDVRGCPPVAVLDYGFWRSEYGGDAGAVGRAIELQGVPFEIIGVARAGFSGAEVGRPTQIYLPLCSEAAVRGDNSMLDRRSTWWLRIMGRPTSGSSIATLDARLSAIAPAVYAATVPEQYGVDEQAEYRTRTLNAIAAPSGLSGLRTRYAGALTVLMAGVGLVLLIACANVANLLLARAAGRRREFAIRAAIGAGRARIVRQLLTESVLIAGIGALLGLLLARAGAQALVTLIDPAGTAVALDLSLNARVLGFTTVVACATALLFGLVPAWRAGRTDPHTTMTAGARGIAEGHRRLTVGKALVAAQVALSLVLLVGASLLVLSLRNLTTMDPGFEPEGVLVASVDARNAGIPDEQIAATQAQILERLRALPGVESASASDLVPIGRSSWNDVLIVEGFSPESEMDALVWFNQIADRYFATMGTRLLAGRDFDERDVVGGPPVAIVNRAVALKFFGEERPLGRTYRLRRGDELGEPVTIVGVVEDAKYQSLREESSATVYVPTSQAETPFPYSSYELRTSGDPHALRPLVKRELAAIDPAIAVDFSTITDQIAESLRRERLLALLSALFGGVALALAMLGLYGVMAYGVARRRNEIGVRIALGAGRARVLRMVLADVARVVLAGLVVGAFGAWASTRLVTTFLYGIEPGDPRVLGLAAITLALVAIAAGAVPAWRAARLDPTAALREE